MTAARIGRIAPGGKVHLALDGQIADHRLRRIVYPVASPTAVAAKNLCRRCFTPNRIGRAQQLLTTATGLVAEGTRRLLADVAATMTTPTEADRLAEMAAEIRATLTATGVLRPVGPEFADLTQRLTSTVELAPAVQALPADERPRTWATLRDEFAATHPQAA